MFCPFSYDVYYYREPPFLVGSSMSLLQNLSIQWTSEATVAPNHDFMDHHIYMSFVGNIVLPKVLNFCSNCKLPLTQPHPSDWKSWLLFSKKNKTENPSKDALDRTENYAKCKLCQLWSDWPGWLHDRDDQTNRSDQTDWGDQTEQGDQTDQCDPGDQTEQTEQVDQTDQTNIPTG